MSVWIGALVLGGLLVPVVVGWRWISRHPRTLDAFRSVAIRRIADAAHGDRVRVVRRLRLGSRTLRSPLSGRTCAFYRVQVEAERAPGWRGMIHEEKSADFIIEDESGCARVETKRLEAVVAFDHEQRSRGPAPPIAALAAFLRRHGEDRSEARGEGERLRFREGALTAGDTVVVVGRARWELDPEPDPSDAPAGYRETAHGQRLVIEAPDRAPVRLTDEPDART